MGMVEISSVIGTGHGLGVENLMGSGLIVGESSAAHDETFALTYVTARSVGIGANLVRLGQQVTQEEDAATTVLTSFSALNKGLVHDVYLSNNQLGGAKIMHPNGIKHLVVQDDAHGISAVGDLRSFVTVPRGHILPIVESRDAVTRDIEVSPPPDGQWSDNAVIEYLVPLGKPEFHRSRQKTMAVEDDSDAVSPRFPSATQLPYDGIWQLRPARPGRHAGSLPTRKVTIEILTTTAAPMGSSPLLWRWSVVAGSVSVTALEHSGQSTSERKKNDDDSDVISKIRWKSTSTATLSMS
jgi:hypothetical protein